MSCPIVHIPVPTFRSFLDMTGKNMLEAQITGLPVRNSTNVGDQMITLEDREDFYDHGPNYNHKADCPFQYYTPTIELLACELRIYNMGLTMDFLGCTEVTLAFRMIYFKAMSTYNEPITPGFSQILDLMQELNDSEDPDEKINLYILQDPDNLTVCTVRFLMAMANLWVSADFQARYPGIHSPTDVSMRQIIFSGTMILELYSRHSRNLEVKIYEDYESDGYANAPLLDKSHSNASSPCLGSVDDEPMTPSSIL
ncbi:uncharacterized protein F4822DRAFT_432143 [Hypoxylon trugodes]|uniref:uncharacterized protein n=1 Tax=Hypoxylon trugodes TaxID=326681 RepID=UPI0021A16549|nr:uncharacterized protein F4822DRAFT_432143 [Hypoxylon trugodes]KAI1385297.1 hypothetical protein F4822DRAFT_432143 [Hypoxylon trugodes]